MDRVRGIGESIHRCQEDESRDAEAPWRSNISQAYSAEYSRSLRCRKGAKGKIIKDFEDAGLESYSFKDEHSDIMTDVNSQGSCGSCYAVAASDAFTLRLRAKCKSENQANCRNIDVAPQGVLDCSFTNQGCEGGFPYLAGQHFASLGAVTNQHSKCGFKYRGENYEKGKYNPMCFSDGNIKECEKVVAQAHQGDDTWGYVGIGGVYGTVNEADMMKDLYCYGPSIVAILAPNSLFSYSSGIFHGSVKQGDIHSSEDNKTYWEKTNHALVLVGWGVEKNIAYRGRQSLLVDKKQLGPHLGRGWIL